ncbi:MAG: hypothetical protein GX986_02345 [Firmicutes bacterium]|nr:hypothetical protein [Bacillota bacterium]
MVARHRWLLFGVAVFSFCLGFALTVSVWKGVPTPSHLLETHKQPGTEQDLGTSHEIDGLLGNGDLDEVSQESELRLLSEADLVEAVISESGQVVTTSTSTLPNNLAGRTLDEVRSIHPDWRVIGFAPERLTIRIPETQMENLYGHLVFLGISGNKVAIFRGKPGIYQQLVRVTTIPISGLPDFEVTNLERGIPYNGEEELSVLLESFRERE